MSRRERNPPTATTSTPPTTVKCAVYCRVSTEEQHQGDFTSIDAQREACRAYIMSQRHEGWLPLPTTYEDAGFSGKDTERPALRQLIADIQAGKIDVVVVHRIDRLSRSVLDFLNLVRFFDEHQVSLASVTQQLRTDTAIGRLIVQILAAFSEFEREMIVERTRDKMRAAKRKGKYCGGMIPLGYDIDPATKRLVINEAEAEIVKAIFCMYLETGRTAEIRKAAEKLGWTAKAWVTKDGQMHKGCALSYGVLATLLRNPVYVGKVRAGDELVPGEHEAIIDEATFARAQAIADALHQFRDDAHFFRRNPQALLKGLLNCGKCGALMTHASSHKRQDDKRYRFYRCLTAIKQGAEACPSFYVPAQEIEQFIVDHLQRLADEPAQISQMVQSVIAHRSVRLPQIAEEISQSEARIARASQTIERLRNSLEAGEEGETTRAFERIHAREQEITEAQQTREVLEQEQADLEQAVITDTAFHYALTLMKDTWSLLTFPERLVLLRRIVKKVAYNTESGKLDVDFNLAGICALHDEHTQTEENVQ